MRVVAVELRCVGPLLGLGLLAVSLWLGAGLAVGCGGGEADLDAPAPTGSSPGDSGGTGGGATTTSSTSSGGSGATGGGGAGGSLPEPGAWRVEGRTLRDPYGREAVLHGVNMAGSHKAEGGNHYLGADTPELYQLLYDDGYRLLRLLTTWAAIMPSMRERQ